MGSHSSMIKLVLDLHNQGYSMVKIAKALDLHIEEVINIINGYT
jgi:hypothetical protein